MNEIQRLTLAAHFLEKMRARGLEISQYDSFDGVCNILQHMGKPYLTPVLSPKSNDFTVANCHWLVALKDGKPVIAAGTRLDVITRGELRTFWQRQFRNHYGAGTLDQIDYVAELLNEQVFGKVAYFGDLFVSEDFRSPKTLNILGDFAMIAHFLIRGIWDPDWTYAFVRKADILRGAALRYGFTRQIPFPQRWIDPKPPRSNTEMCLLLSREEAVHWHNGLLSAIQTLEE